VIGQRSYGKGSVQNLLELEDGNSVLKLTVAGYHRPNGDNIHRFRDAKSTDKWGVAPSPGMEIKLTPSEYVRWFVGRRDRDLKSAAKGHRKEVKAPPEPETAKTKDAEPAKTKDAEPAKTKDVEKAKTKDVEKAKPQLRVRSPHADPGPFVDKVLDKAIEVIKGKIAEQAKAKAA
jgi:carboxyl-terminal processing protease